MIGLQNGVVAFDQAADTLTATQLRELYAQNEHELTHLIHEDDALSTVQKIDSPTVRLA